ncbi:TPA: cytochrome c [Vibrio parahaemolyticus]|uniref:c-type cytochrome n=1 Tax=Vibrio natriegens TaxID=691 RepID=UPI000803CEF1|nr:cytochrome c [Vibrio natriegens]ANQ28632.1 hypothetical protein BA894_19665 [Vibrio natriegens]
MLKFKTLLVLGITSLVSHQALANGELIFKQKCSACHQQSGEGISGAFPALKGNQFVNEQTDKVINTVMYGRAGMPSFKKDLDDKALYEVISYIKSSWGNQGKEITLDQVVGLRTAMKGHQSLARED